MIPQIASATSTLSDSAAALAEVGTRVKEQLPHSIDLALVFVSHHHRAVFDELGKQLSQRLEASAIYGCSGEAIVGTGCEIENSAAISLWAASLPDTTILAMHLHHQETSEGDIIVGWSEELPARWPEGAALLLLGDPFSFQVPTLLERLAEDQPHIPIIGGLASGGTGPGEHALFFRGCRLDGGAIAILLHGPMRLHHLVSQGCRPIGQTFVITRCDQNVIHELGGQQAIAQLQRMFQELPRSDQALAQRGLHIGRVINEYQERFEQGDFLIRNVLGFDPDSGSVAVNDFVRPGKTIRFHVRDQHSADVELRQLLSRLDRASIKPAGGLLFTCNGRGTRLFDQPSHDAACVQETFGDIPLAGFFAQGELGPISGQNFLHGFTASLALFDADPGDSQRTTNSSSLQTDQGLS